MFRFLSLICWLVVVNEGSPSQEPPTFNRIILVYIAYGIVSRRITVIDSDNDGMPDGLDVTGNGEINIPVTCTDVCGLDFDQDGFPDVIIPLLSRGGGFGRQGNGEGLQPAGFAELDLESFPTDTSPMQQLITSPLTALRGAEILMDEDELLDLLFETEPTPVPDDETDIEAGEGDSTPEGAALITRAASGLAGLADSNPAAKTMITLSPSSLGNLWAILLIFLVFNILVCWHKWIGFRNCPSKQNCSQKWSGYTAQMRKRCQRQRS